MMISFTDSILGSFFFLYHFLLTRARVCVITVVMASIDIVQLADALSQTHVDDGELNFQGLGLKLDNAASGETVNAIPLPLILYHERCAFFLYIRGLAPVFSILARVSHLLQWRRLFMTLSSCSACELCVWRETLWVWKQPRPSPKLWRAKTCSRYCSGCCYLFVYFL